MTPPARRVPRWHPRAAARWGRWLPVTFAVAFSVGASALSLEEDPDLAVRIGGSSAQDQLLEGLMRLRAGIAGAPNICEEGSLDIYAAVIDGTRQLLYYCLTDANIPGVGAGRRLAVFKSSGGSGDGVQPLLEAREMPFLAIDRLRSGGCAARTRILPTADLAAYTEHRDCAAGAELRLPDAGISDLEPSLLVDDAANLVTRSLAQLVWGLPVSRNLRNALQALQGLVPADVAHDDPRREAEAVMPSLSSTQVSSIFAGSVASWAAFYDDHGVPITRSAALPAPPATGRNLSGTRPGAYRPAPGAGEPIYLCRRIDSSGTQIAYGTHYLRQRCTSGAPSFVAPDDGSDALLGGSARALLDTPVPAGRVFAGIGTSDVKACLDLHDDHNRWAIGMFSTENPGNNTSREFRHVKIDGFAPSLLNAHNGRWRHVSSASIQWPALGALPDPPPVSRSVLEFIAAQMGQPAVLRSLNRDFRHAWGQGGYLSITASEALRNGMAMTAERLAALPIAGVTNARDGEAQNCQVPLLTGASAIAPARPVVSGS